jgi:hypothetical protein
LFASDEHIFGRHRTWCTVAQRRIAVILSVTHPTKRVKDRPRHSRSCGKPSAAAVAHGNSAVVGCGIFFQSF